jgi:hypothetical protein
MVQSGDGDPVDHRRRAVAPARLAAAGRRAARSCSCTVWASTSAATTGWSQALHAAGWAVTGYDQRGHGRSGGARGVIPDADALCRDLAMSSTSRGGARPARWSCWATAWAALVAARFVAEALSPKPATWSRRVDALVLSSPALDCRLSPGQKLLLGLARPAGAGPVAVQWPAAGLDLARRRGGAATSRPAGARPGHAAPGALHRRCRALVRSLAPRWPCPRCSCGPGRPLRGPARQRRPLPPRRRRRCVQAQALARSVPRDLQRTRARAGGQRLLEFLRELAPSQSAASPT